MAHSTSVLTMTPYVMGERKLSVPIYFAAGVISLCNGVNLLLKLDLEAAYYLWGSVNTVIWVRYMLVVVWLFADVTWDL